MIIFCSNCCGINGIHTWFPHNLDIIKTKKIFGSKTSTDVCYKDEQTFECCYSVFTSSAFIETASTNIQTSLTPSCQY